MDQSNTYITIPEACRELRVSRSTLYAFLGTELPVTRFGRCVRILRDDLEGFKQARRERQTQDGPSTDLA